jgi:hypothetical protein
MVIQYCLAYVFLGKAPGAGKDYSDGQDYSADEEEAGHDYSDADPAAANATAATGKASDHDEDRIVNGYSVDGRPWYVALQV